MMKKIIVLLLVAVMSLSLVACGGKEVETSADMSQQTEENKSDVVAEQETEESVNLSLFNKEIKITADNWQEYFEIRFDFGQVELAKNAFDEVEGVNVSNGGTVFALKEEYLDSYVSVDVAVEVAGNDAETALVKYNLNDSTYELIEYIETGWSDPPFYEMPANYSNKTFMEKITDVSVMLNPIYDYYEVESIEDNYVNMYTIAHPNCEIIRIQGTLIIKE